jgi:hypothetical protein
MIQFSIQVNVARELTASLSVHRITTRSLLVSPSAHCARGRLPLECLCPSSSPLYSWRPRVRCSPVNLPSAQAQFAHEHAFWGTDTPSGAAARASPARKSCLSNPQPCTTTRLLHLGDPARLQGQECFGDFARACPVLPSCTPRPFELLSARALLLGRRLSHACISVSARPPPVIFAPLSPPPFSVLAPAARRATPMAIRDSGCGVWGVGGFRKAASRVPRCRASRCWCYCLVTGSSQPQAPKTLIPQPWTLDPGTQTRNRPKTHRGGCKRILTTCSAHVHSGDVIVSQTRHGAK